MVNIGFNMRLFTVCTLPSKGQFRWLFSSTGLYRDVHSQALLLRFNCPQFNDDSLFLALVQSQRTRRSKYS